MKSKKIVTEVIWLRTIACLSIVLLHSIVESTRHYTSIEGIYTLITFATLFGTPAFVFISEFLVSKVYKDEVPKGFLKKRVNLLIFPYLFMGFLYSLVYLKEASLTSYFTEAFRNIFMGTFTAYFVLIIFQFFIMHAYLVKYIKNKSPALIIALALLVNIIYLGIFTFIPVPDFPFADYLWKRGYWLPFFGWIFYFVLGYYAGRYHALLMDFINKYWVFILLAPLLLLGALLYFEVNWLEIGLTSKRIEMLFYTPSIIFLVFFLVQKIHTVPYPIHLINSYSFSIYLMHKLFITNFAVLSFMNRELYIAVVFIASLAFSIFVSYLLNKTNIGKYLVGRPLKLIKENHRPDMAERNLSIKNSPL